MKFFSPAKINLTLDVFEKKSGAAFHEIETIYQLLDWGDEIEISESEDFILEGDFDCNTEENLVYKSFLLINKFTQKTKTVKVSVAKNIPTKSGLGGGSSNAASFVKGYFKFFNLGEVPNDLIKALGNLGKDIPFFFQDQSCALGTHFGENIQSVNFNFSGQKVYLYFPNFKNETKEAYAQLKNFNTTYTQDFLNNPNLGNCGNAFKNIFDQKIYSKLDLSGSGSAFFSFEKFNIPECKVVKTRFL